MEDLQSYLQVGLVALSTLGVAIRILILDYSSLRLTKLSKTSQLIELCSHEDTRQTLSIIREELIFKRLTGASLSLEKIQKINEIYASGKMRHNELAAISRYLDTKKEHLAISFSKFDAFEAGVSFVFSWVILALMAVSYAAAAWPPGNPLTALLIPALCFPFLYFISDGNRKYRIAKRIKQDFKL